MPVLSSRAVTLATTPLSVRMVVTALGHAASRFRRHRGFLLAGALAFSVASCLAPMLLVLLSVAGFLLERDELAVRIFDAVVLAFPGYGTEAAQLVGLLVTERRVTGLVGTVGLAVFATPLFALLRTIVNTAFGVRRRRGAVHGFFFDLGVVVALGTAWTLMVAALIALRWLGDALGHELGIGWLTSPDLRLLGFTVLTFAAGSATLLFVYGVFPNVRVALAPTAATALAMMAIWEVARVVFGSYVVLFGVYGRLYGSLGIVVASLVWLYYSTVLVVFGAELAAVANGAAASDDDGAPAR